MLKNLYEKVEGLRDSYTKISDKDEGDHEAIKALSMVLGYIDEELDDPVAASSHYTHDEVGADD